MSNKLCLARLTDFAKTKSVSIGNSKHRCSIVKVCNSVAMEGNNLCEWCFMLPKEGRYKDGKYHGRNVHGLITEPIPEDSHIYGSPWYKGVVELYGPLEDKEWIKMAEEAQQKLEEEVRKRIGMSKNDSLTTFIHRPSADFDKSASGEAPQEQKPKEKKQVQRGTRKKEVEDDEMPVKKVPDKGQKTTLLQSFVPIKQFYIESEKQPRQLATDSIKMKKVMDGEKEIWLLENGMKFTVDVNGEVGELIK